MVSNNHILRSLEKEYSVQRLDFLFAQFNRWRRIAYGQTLKNIRRKRDFSSLLDKMGTEHRESKDVFEMYIRTAKIGKYAKETYEEIFDFGNMAMINMPLVYDGRKGHALPNLYQTLLRLAENSQKYDLSPLYDLISIFDYKAYFGVWIKELASFDLRMKARVKGDTERKWFILKIFDDSFGQIRRHAEELIDQKFFGDKLPHTDMRVEWVGLMGDALNYSMILANQVREFTYEDYFSAATTKMRLRNARYHGLTRLDEKLRVKFPAS